MKHSLVVTKLAAGPSTEVDPDSDSGPDPVVVAAWRRNVRTATRTCDQDSYCDGVAVTSDRTRSSSGGAPPKCSAPTDPRHSIECVTRPRKSRRLTKRTAMASRATRSCVRRTTRMTASRPIALHSSRSGPCVLACRDSRALDSNSGTRRRIRLRRRHQHRSPTPNRDCRHNHSHDHRRRRSKRAEER